jgi:hypothetical protein
MLDKPMLTRPYTR